MNKNSKIYVAGHNGMVGSAIVRRLKADGYMNIVSRCHSELDLTQQSAVEGFFVEENPEYVFMAAARVGGIMANMSEQVQFLLENLQMDCSIIDSAYRHGVKKLLFLGSSCIYPQNAKQPIPEKSLLTGSLEPTNEGYAIAKIAGIKLCEYFKKQYGADFISIMPCNLYGYNDNFNTERSHMLPALIRRFHEAKVNNSDTVTVWGTGKAYRELLFVDDLANACVFVMNNFSGNDLLNVGYGVDYTIAEIADMLRKISGFEGSIIYDSTKPDGMFRKIVDSSRIRVMGWKPEVELYEGIRMTYNWYVNNIDNIARK